MDKNQPLFPPEITKGAIYFIRNPLDVLVSFAYHSAKPVYKMISSINDSNYAFCDKNDKLQNQLRQILGSWSDHAVSWINQDLIPIHIMRYEDMVNNTFNTFKQVVQFIGLEKSDKQIKIAIAKSSFSVLSEQEKSWLKEAVSKSIEYQRKLWIEAETEAIEEVRKAGVEIIRPEKEPFAQRAEKVYRQYQDDEELYGVIQQIQKMKKS